LDFMILRNIGCLIQEHQVLDKGTNRSPPAHGLVHLDSHLLLNPILYNMHGKRDKDMLHLDSHLLLNPILS